MLALLSSRPLALTKNPLMPPPARWRPPLLAADAAGGDGGVGPLVSGGVDRGEETEEEDNDHGVSEGEEEGE